jgi:MFS family permease
MSTASDHGDLPAGQQTRNVLLYAANVALIYLASPVTYVGLVHGALLKRLDYSNTVANLPASVYNWATPLPVLVVWYFPRIRQLKPLIIGSYLAIALIGAVVTVAVWLLDRAWVLAALVAHAAVLGCALGVWATCQWEILGRGVSATRRGQAFALAFGAGPILAVIASLVSQLVLPPPPKEKDLSEQARKNVIAATTLALQQQPLTAAACSSYFLTVPKRSTGDEKSAESEDGQGDERDSPSLLPSVAVPYRWNFASLFAASIPIMALGAFLSSRFIVPHPGIEVPRQPFRSGILGGFGEFFGYRLILLATIGYILVYSGNMVMTNISLFTKVAIGRPAEEYAGLQLALRFGFKIVAGFFLGWLLMRTNPKTLLMVTAGLTLAGVAWALGAPGKWFLISFGILGAGELFGVYYPNYILGCSEKSNMRRNMAFTSLVVVFTGFPPLLYGFISDTLGKPDKKFGFQASFVMAMLLLVAAMILVLLTLPAQPRPRESDSESPQLAPTSAKEDLDIPARST